MAVQVGETAPDFAADAFVHGSWEPSRISLAEFAGKWVVLFFYPRDFTFVCPTELAGLTELQSQFEQQNAVVIGASTDSFYCHKAWFESDARLAGFAYPVIADASHQLSGKYGVLLRTGAALRATFVIDPEGVLAHMSITVDGVGRNIEEILRTLQALQTGELCPAGWRPGDPTLVDARPAVA